MTPWTVNRELSEAGFVYRLTFTIPHSGEKRYYIGRKRWQSGWHDYGGGGLLVEAHYDLFGRDDTIREIVSVHDDLDELEEAERHLISISDAVYSDEFYNLMSPEWHPDGTPVWNDPRERDAKVLRQFSSWFPTPEPRAKWRVVALDTLLGLRGFKNQATASKRLGIPQPTICNILRGRHCSSHDTITDIRYLPTRAIPHIPNLRWED